MLSILSAILILIPTIGVATEYEEKELTLLDRLMHEPAYSVLEIDDQNNFNTKNIKTISIKETRKLSDEELYKIAENNLREVILQQKNGARIVWNDNILESKIKEEFPHVYAEIKSNNLIKKEFKIEELESASLSGSKTQSFTHTVYSYLGLRLFSITLQATWSWEVARVYNVRNIRTSGESHDVLWSYAKTVFSRGYYRTEPWGEEVYAHDFQAHFKRSTLGGANAYPEIGVELYPGTASIVFTDDGI